MKDLLGQAALDYLRGALRQNPVTETQITEADEFEVKYLFRSYGHMPEIEKWALDHACGSILDAGCGAGSHALELQNRGFDVTAIDISNNFIETCRLRGVKNARVADIMKIEEKFDTILLLMNGTGICGRLSGLADFLDHLRNMLAKDGQILIDSSDIIYMFEQEDGSFEVPAEGFYGELIFELSYDGQTEDPFPWLYVPFELLREVAHSVGLACDKALDGPHYDYLARLYAIKKPG